MFCTCLIIGTLLDSPHQKLHTLRYTVRGVRNTNPVIGCNVKGLDTIKDALDNCPFFRMFGIVNGIVIRSSGCQDWVPDNLPCNLMCEANCLEITVRPVSSPQPTYPPRLVKAPGESFIIRIATRRGSKRILCLRRTGSTPDYMLVVVDPTKTIRESLRDDGRFNSNVLQSPYTHLKGDCVTHADQLGSVLKRKDEYDLYTKAPLRRFLYHRRRGVGVEA